MNQNAALGLNTRTFIALGTFIALSGVAGSRRPLQRRGPLNQLGMPQGSQGLPAIYDIGNRDGIPRS
jgi:hypothetical protein